MTDVYLVTEDFVLHRMASLSEGSLLEHKMAACTSETLPECSSYGQKHACAGKCINDSLTPLGTRKRPTANEPGIYATTILAFGQIFK